MCIHLICVLYTREGYMMYHTQMTRVSTQVTYDFIDKCHVQTGTCTRKYSPLHCVSIGGWSVTPMSTSWFVRWRRLVRHGTSGCGTSSRIEWWFLPHDWPRIAGGTAYGWNYRWCRRRCHVASFQWKWESCTHCQVRSTNMTKLWHSLLWYISKELNR